MSSMKDKVVVVTGGNSGIGKGIAHRFHDEGAKVVIFGRNLKSLEQVKEKLSTNVLAVQGDITKKEDILKLYQQTLKTFGNIDVLIANAGVGEKVALDQATEEKFDTMADINYKGAYFTVRYALDFLAPDASILLIASTAALLGVAEHSIYSSTKAAVIKLAKSFAIDLAPKKIRVNSISPGYIETPIFDDRLKKDPSYLEGKKQYIPLSRIGRPEDIAHAAVFLSSPEASYITGANLVIDGGLSSFSPIR